MYLLYQTRHSRFKKMQHHFSCSHFLKSKPCVVLPEAGAKVEPELEFHLEQGVKLELRPEQEVKVDPERRMAPKRRKSWQVEYRHGTL